MESLHDLINDILADNPSPGTLFIVLSKMKKDGHIKGVIMECIKALAIYTDDIRIRQLLVESYLDSGQVSLAESESDKITEQLLNLNSVYRTQDEICSRLGRNDDAIEDLKNFLASRSDEEEIPEKQTEIEPGKEDLEDFTISEKEETLPEIATPTLAEIYLEQGQVMEAIKTYEKIVAENPHDEHSTKRLGELVAQNIKDETDDENIPNRGKQSKEKMIAILDTWRMNIRKQKELTA